MRSKKGLQLPPIGFGTANLGTRAKEAVLWAIEAGYRLIDTAAVYGSEEAVGEAVNEALQRGIATREEFFIQSKMAPQKHGYDEAMRSFENSLAKLKLDYLDAFLIHWPVPRGQEEVYQEKNLETWRAFLALKNGGVLRYVGVCNFLERHLLWLTEGGLELPAINQLELHPGYQQRGLVRFCRERGIAIEAWSPLGRGLLATPEFVEMAASYGKDVGQLALRWSIQSGFVPLSGSSNREHIASNLKVCDFTINAADMACLNELNTCDGHQDIWSYRRQLMY